MCSVFHGGGRDIRQKYVSIRYKVAYRRRAAIAATGTRQPGYRENIDKSQAFHGKSHAVSP